MIASRKNAKWLRVVGWIGTGGAITFLLTLAADRLFGLLGPLTLPGSVGFALAGLSLAVGLIVALVGLRCPQCRARVTAQVFAFFTDPPGTFVCPADILSRKHSGERKVVGSNHLLPPTQSATLGPATDRTASVWPR